MAAPIRHACRKGVQIVTVWTIRDGHLHAASRLHTQSPYRPEREAVHLPAKEDLLRILNLTVSIVPLVCVLTISSVLAVGQERAKQPTLQKAKQKEPKPEELKPLSFWMEKKIEYSQQMLRGLVAGDLQQVADRAEQMRVVSKIEGWIRGKVPGYRAQSQVFQFANNEILRQSRANNLAGTTMAFQQLTASCVSCHRILRETNGKQPTVKKQATE